LLDNLIFLGTIDGDASKPLEKPLERSFEQRRLSKPMDFHPEMKCEKKCQREVPVGGMGSCNDHTLWNLWSLAFRLPTGAQKDQVRNPTKKHP